VVRRKRLTSRPRPRRRTGVRRLLTLGASDELECSLVASPRVVVSENRAMHDAHTRIVKAWSWAGNLAWHSCKLRSPVTSR
jgi:hypothetical protein